MGGRDNPKSIKMGGQGGYYKISTVLLEEALAPPGMGLSSLCNKEEHCQFVHKDW